MVLVLLVVLLPVPTANNVHFLRFLFYSARKPENEAADMEASRRPNNPAAGS